MAAGAMAAFCSLAAMLSPIEALQHIFLTVFRKRHRIVWATGFLLGAVLGGGDPGHFLSGGFRLRPPHALLCSLQPCVIRQIINPHQIEIHFRGCSQRPVSAAYVILVMVELVGNRRLTAFAAGLLP